tara:strand:+ start:63 stop:740 length:678 start_codon:yes stop_codon:yes gene_type:complete
MKIEHWEDAKRWMTKRGPNIPKAQKDKILAKHYKYEPWSNPRVERLAGANKTEKLTVENLQDKEFWDAWNDGKKMVKYIDKYKDGIPEKSFETVRQLNELNEWSKNPRAYYAKQKRKTVEASPAQMAALEKRLENSRAYGYDPRLEKKKKIKKVADSSLVSPQGPLPYNLDKWLDIIHPYWWETEYDKPISTEEEVKQRLKRLREKEQRRLAVGLASLMHLRPTG